MGMTAELKTLKTEDFQIYVSLANQFQSYEDVESYADVESIESMLEEVKTMDEFFPEFNLAKSYVKKTREELRKLAYRTVIDVSEVKPLIEALDQTNGALFLRISIDRMKDLINETLVTLEEAKIKYELGIQTFESISFKSKTQTFKNLPWISHLKSNLT